jgi:hypothetical protein
LGEVKAKELKISLATNKVPFIIFRAGNDKLDLICSPIFLNLSNY